MQAENLDSLDVADTLALVAGWRPPQYGHDRRTWTTWSEFLATYEAVRDEIFATWPPPHKEPFAEKVRRYVKIHGLAALGTGAFEGDRYAE